MSRFETSLLEATPDPELVCGICISVLDKPLETPCRHVFCGVCINKALDESRKCPICRTHFRPRNLRAVVPLVQNMINKLSTGCKNKENGCKEVFTLECFEAHTKGCKFELKKCKFDDCNTEIILRDIKRHHRSCVHRVFRCTKGCELLVKVGNVTHECTSSLKTCISVLMDENSILRERIRYLETNEESDHPTILYNTRIEPRLRGIDHFSDNLIPLAEDSSDSELSSIEEEEGATSHNVIAETDAEAGDIQNASVAAQTPMLNPDSPAPVSTSTENRRVLRARGRKRSCRGTPAAGTSNDEGPSTSAGSSETLTRANSVAHVVVCGQRGLRAPSSAAQDTTDSHHDTPPASVASERASSGRRVMVCARPGQRGLRAPSRAAQDTTDSHHDTPPASVASERSQPTDILNILALARNRQTRRITLKVTCDVASTVHFNINNNTPLQKLMQMYCNRAGIQKDCDTIFLFNWILICDEDTASVLEMKQGDSIICIRRATL